jgi:hypothetical protein
MYFDAKTGHITLKSCHLVNHFLIKLFLVLKLRTPLLDTQQFVDFLMGIVNVSLCSTSAVSAKIILLDADQLQIFWL